MDIVNPSYFIKLLQGDIVNPSYVYDDVVLYLLQLLSMHTPH